MAIKLSQRAVQHIQKFSNDRGGATWLRLGVRMAGCSQLEYVVEFVDQPNPDDLMFEEQGVKIVIASDKLAQLEGVELDFVREGLNEKFTFNNPNAEGYCGCGRSFRLRTTGST